MTLPSREQKAYIEQIYASNHVNDYTRRKLSDAFLRPPYQYTSQEVSDPGWSDVRNNRFDMSY